jgi:hypothetical protein
MAYGKWVLCTSTNILLLLSTFDEIQFSERERELFGDLSTHPSL